ncbi:MAG: TetR/AcrR family transcriptional regulator [Dehalococcoidia bacterium]|nr:TetR/AcrR family transcriptional regulator [Dehalococcoidia bacterium]
MVIVRASRELAQAGIRTFSKNEKLVQERRQHILQSALKLFLQDGFQATRLRDIAEASGLSEGSIYRYIGSKDDLLHLLCLNRPHGREGLEAVLATIGDVSVTEKLEASIRYHFQVGDRSRDSNLFFNREIRLFSSEDRRILLESQMAIIDFFKNLLEEGIRTGEFQIRSALAVAHNILMLGHDWGLRRWYLAKHFTLEEYTEIQLELILRQIAVNSGK